MQQEKTSTIPTINAETYVERANSNRDPFAFEPQYYLLNETEAQELLSIDPDLEEREFETENTNLIK